MFDAIDKSFKLKLQNDSADEGEEFQIKQESSMTDLYEGLS